MTGQPDLERAALAYAERGWPVIALHHVRPDRSCSCGHGRCRRAGKHPHYEPGLLEHGLKEATTDPDRILAWWRRWPEANLGLRTGIAFDVLDLDGHAGVTALRRAATAGGWALPASGPLVRSGGGGWHYYIAPTGARCPKLPIGNVDWRGQDGLIVAPPSRHASGHRYRWHRGPELPLPEAPMALRLMLLPARSLQPPGAVSVGPVADGHAYGQRALAEELAKLRAAIPNQERNKTLNRTAFRIYQLVAGGVLDEPLVTGAFTDTALAIGLDPAEVRATLRSARNAALRFPRGLPDRPGARRDQPARPTLPAQPVLDRSDGLDRT